MTTTDPTAATSAQASAADNAPDPSPLEQMTAGRPTVLWNDSADPRELAQSIASLEERLNQIPGVVSVGLFARRPADVVIVGGEPPQLL